MSVKGTRRTFLGSPGAAIGFTSLARLGASPTIPFHGLADTTVPPDTNLSSCDNGFFNRYTGGHATPNEVP